MSVDKLYLQYRKKLLLRKGTTPTEAVARIVPQFNDTDIDWLVAFSMVLANAALKRQRVTLADVAVLPADTPSAD
jgi:hypothetical protein